MGTGQIGLSDGDDEERPRSARRQHPLPPAGLRSSKTTRTEGSDTIEDLRSHTSGNVVLLAYNDRVFRDDSRYFYRKARS